MLNRMAVKNPKSFTPRYENVLYLRQKPIYKVNGGIDKSVSPIEIADNYLYDGYNVFYSPVESQIKTRPGYSLFGLTAPLPDPVMNITQFFKYTPAGSSYLCAFTTKNIYYYNTSTKVWDLKSPQTVICDCEDVWTAMTGTACTADTSVYRYGSKSAKTVISGIDTLVTEAGDTLTTEDGDTLTEETGFTTGIASFRNLAAPLDVHTKTHLYFYIRSSIALAAGDVQIKIYDTADHADLLESLDVPAISLVDTWYEFCVAFSNAAALTSIASIGLNVVTAIGSCTIYLDNIMAVECLTGTYENKIITEQIYDDNDSEVKFLMTNGVDNIKFWNGTGYWADLGGTPNVAKDMLNYNHYLMLSDVIVSANNMPQRIDWPVIGQPEDWSSSGSGNNILAGSNTENIKLSQLRGYLVILKKDWISLGSFVGGVDPFTFEENKIKPGCIAAGSVQMVADDKLLYLGYDNVYRFNGFTSTPVATKVATMMMADINPDKLSTIHSVNIVDKKLYLLFVPSKVANYPDTAWAYCYDDKNESWWRWKYNDNITCAGTYNDFTAKTIGEMLSAIGTYNIRLGYIGSESLMPTILYGSYGGYIYSVDSAVNSDNGNAITAYVDTKSFIFDGIDRYTELAYVVVDGRGTGLSIYHSGDDGRTFTNHGAVSISALADEVFTRNIRKSRERHMVRFYNNTLNKWFSISGFTLGYICKERLLE